jgi:hypothetical protein
VEVELILPKKELFIGSYIKVNVVIDPASGRPIEDLEFILPDGPPAGIISLSRDADFNPDKPDIMLCVGYRPGTYSLKAWSKQAHIFIAETEFVITDIWKDENEGPSMWFSSANELYVAVVGSAWGGGTPTTGPQNIPLTPTKKERRIAILLIDTTSKKYPEDTTTLQGIKDRWLNEIVRGVTVGGVTRSVAHYYREVSYNNLEVSAELFGPVSLTKDWDTQFGVKEDGLPRVKSCVLAISCVGRGSPN